MNLSRRCGGSLLLRLVALNRSNCTKTNMQIIHRISCRHFHFSQILKNNQSPRRRYQISSVRNYVVAGGLVVFGASYAAVPLYRMFCQQSGFGGTTQHDDSAERLQSITKNKKRTITVKFNSDLAASMAWNFKPVQNSVQVYPGETALAFYTAKNPTDKPIVGVSTYNVIPFEAGQYFYKIQCFCFEEQLLNPQEEVDMPVFFYIDPEYAEDPKLEFIDEVVLSYTFFEAKEGMKLPVPSYASGIKSFGT